MWGQGRNKLAIFAVSRIIPMRVGTRFGNVRNAKRNWDHPHACGDKTVPLSNTNCRRGSSPCVWGQGSCQSCGGNNLGIIPMRVGTSYRGFLLDWDSRDHPHACGDKPAYLSIRIFFRGSSPCVWGQACVLVDKDFFQRIIPMRVGTRRSGG